MALKLRLSRAGAKKRPYYHIVATDSRNPRDGRFIEKVGSYNPMLPKDSEDRVKLKEDRIKHWLSVGAKPSERVEMFLGAAKIVEMPAQKVRPNKSKPKEKAQERLREKAEAAEAAKQAAEEAKQAAKEAAEAEKAAAAEAAAAPAEEPKAEEAAPAEAEAAPAEEAKAEEKPAEEAAPAEEEKAE